MLARRVPVAAESARDNRYQPNTNRLVGPSQRQPYGPVLVILLASTAAVVCQYPRPLRCQQCCAPCASKKHLPLPLARSIFRAEIAQGGAGFSLVFSTGKQPREKN